MNACKAVRPSPIKVAAKPTAFDPESGSSFKKRDLLGSLLAGAGEKGLEKNFESRCVSGDDSDRRIARDGLEVAHVHPSSWVAPDIWRLDVLRRSVRE